MKNKYQKLIIPEDNNTKESYLNRFRFFLLEKADDTIFEDAVDNIINFILETNKGFKNFKNWYKVIWNDRGWDHGFIYDILEHKLLLQREVLINGYCAVESLEVINRDLTICLNLIDKLGREFYSHEYFDYENLKDYMDKYKSSVRKVDKKYGKNKTINISEVAQFNEDKARALLFRIMNEKIDYWWD